MTIRIPEPNLFHTQTLLSQVLSPIIGTENRVAFLCDAGSGADVMARLRVMISRGRRALESKGKKPKRFRLHNTIHRETHDGIRYDCLVIWQTTGESHILMEELEDLLVATRMRKAA